MSQPIRGWGGHLSCPVGPKQYKLSRGRWDLVSYQVSLNSVQQVQRRSQKCEKLVHLIVLCVVKEGTATSPIVFSMDWIVAFWDYFQPIAGFFFPILCVKLFFCHESPDIWIRRVWYMLNYQIRTCKSIIYNTSSDRYKIFQITTQLSDIHQVRYIPSLGNMIWPGMNTPTAVA